MPLLFPQAICCHHLTTFRNQRMYDINRRHQLLSRLKEKHPELNALLEEMERHGGIENMIYKFYQHSFKVYRVQALTEEAVGLLQSLLPDRPLDAEFRQIVSEGTGKEFELAHNQDWLRHTRPMVEAFFHAHYFVKMACKYGQALDTPPQGLASGYLALLDLYDLQ
jgi:hypothetical protein